MHRSASGLESISSFGDIAAVPKCCTDLSKFIFFGDQFQSVLKALDVGLGHTDRLFVLTNLRLFTLDTFLKLYSQCHIFTTFEQYSTGGHKLQRQKMA